MAECKTCGEKARGNRAFPSAVVEINNPEQLVLLRKVIIPASMGDDTENPPAIGKYRNVLLYYEVSGHSYLYSSDGIPTRINNVPKEVLDKISEIEGDIDTLETGLANEIITREAADNYLQQEIDDIKNSPDVVDIVATYADLMAYDTSGLGDKDIIRVLSDETHEGQSTYYRWSLSTQTWTFIGTVGDYYTKEQVDALLDGKQDELTPGENISIVDESGELVISATDTTYNNFVGTDGTTAGQAGLVPAPTTADVGKVLGANGNWITGGPTVVQTTGTSTTDVMSQSATTRMVYNDSTYKGVQIGPSSFANGSDQVSIGSYSRASGARATAVGTSAEAFATDSVAIGSSARATRSGEVNIGAGTSGRGYSGTNYRVLGGVHDPLLNNDAATKGYVDAKLSYKQDELTAGTGISIAEESGALVISTTGAVVSTINSQDWSNLWQ